MTHHPLGLSHYPELNDIQTRRVRVLEAILWYLWVLLGIAIVIGLPFVFAHRVGSAIVIAVLGLILLLTRLVMRRGHVALASFGLLTLLWLVFAGLTSLTGGIYSTNLALLVAIAGITGLLLGERAATVASVATIGFSFVLAWADMTGHPPPKLFPAPPMSRFGMIALASGLLIIPLFMALRSLGATFSRLAEELMVRRRAERLLLRSEERYRTILETMNDGVVVLDAPSGTIVDANRKAGQLFGLAPHDMLDRTLAELSTDPSGAERDDFLSRLAGASARGSGLFEWQIRTLDAQPFWVEMNVRRATVGDEERVFISIRNIDERKSHEAEKDRLAAQLRQAQKMEALGRLAGGIAHDFNNLLTGILGNAELLLLDLESTSPLRSEAEGVRHAAQRAAELTAQLLSFSRKRPLEPQPLDLSHSVVSVQKLLRRVLGENIEVVVSMHNGLAPVFGDPAQLEQILVNLSINAMDAMPQGGRLEISLGNLGIGPQGHADFPEAPAGNYVALSVSDTGTGIPQELVREIFEPFFTTKPRGKGTGLGLSMVLGAVQQHNGYISVHSTPGLGSTFRIILPRHQGTSAISVQPTLEDALGRGTETLIVTEDDTLVRRIMTHTLRRLGYTVLDFESAETTLAAPPEELAPARLLITDLVMPGVNGRELARLLLARDNRLKVLYCSGYAEPLLSTNGVVEHGVDLLKKPFTPQQLAARVRHLLDG